MNYSERTIENFERCNAGVPRHLARHAITERFTDGWYSDDLAKLETVADVMACADFDFLEKSPAWGYFESLEEVAKAILFEIKS